MGLVGMFYLAIIGFAFDVLRFWAEYVRPDLLNLE